MSNKKHAVVGGGNLGLDIIAFGNRNKIGEFRLFTRDNGYEYPGDSLLLGLDQYQPDHIWVTVGAGSVEGAKENFQPYIDLHISLPMKLLSHFTKSHIHLFTSDYTAYPRQSLYAFSKYAMENFAFIKGRSNVKIYRVSNLYGTHKPWTTFPGKLLKRYPEPCVITLPKNLVMPTPTAWLAENLLKYAVNLYEENTNLYDMTPQGAVPLFMLAQKVFEDTRYEIVTGGVDSERPPQPVAPGNALPGMIREDWSVLWYRYFNKGDFV